MRAVEKLKLLGNALTASSFNPYTAQEICWSDVWNACRNALLLDASTSPLLLHCMLTTPVCVNSSVPSVHYHKGVVWVGEDVLNSIHPDELKTMVENIYEKKLNNLLHAPSDISVFNEPRFDFWTKNVWSASDITRWEKWVEETIEGSPIGPWVAPQTSASRFRSCAISDLALNTSALQHLQLGTNFIDVLHIYCNRVEELNVQQMLVIKQLSEMCLPQDNSSREEVLQKLAQEWIEQYNDGPEVDRMLSLTTGTYFRSTMRWKDNLNIHWLKICQNWNDNAHNPCASSKVLDGLLGAYSPTSTSSLGEWVGLFVQAHRETQTPISDFAATHLTLSGSPLLIQAFPVLTEQQRKVAHEAAVSGMFPQLQKTLDSMGPKNVVRLPTRHPFV